MTAQQSWWLLRLDVVHRPAARRADPKQGMDGCRSRRQDRRDPPSREWQGVHRCARPALGPADGILASRRATSFTTYSSAPMRGRCSCRNPRVACSTRTASSVRSGTRAREDRPLRPWQAPRLAIYPPSADRLVTLTHNQWLVRDARSGRVRGSGSPAGADDRLASHPDGRTMLAASDDGVVRLWQISPDAEPVSEWRNRHAGIDDRDRTRPPDAGCQPLLDRSVDGRADRHLTWPRVRGDGN